MNRRKKILFVKSITRSFIEQDVEILRRNFELREVNFILDRKNLKGTLTTIFNMVKGVLWADATFSWFADLHAAFAVFLSMMLRKGSIVVAGGYDVAKEPEINYGLMRLPQSREARLAKFALKYADKVLAVSEFNKTEASEYVDPKKLKLVYNAVDCDVFKPGEEKDENLVITVGGVTEQTLKKKGLKTFVDSATYLPSVKFILIGHSYDNSIELLKEIAPSNVEFWGYIPFKEIHKCYQKAKVYCQLSYHESFGLSLAEAMACECIPVVADRAALPEVVGDTGFYVPYGDPKATAEAIECALKSDKGKLARERVKRFFSIANRRKELIRAVEEVVTIARRI